MGGQQGGQSPRFDGNPISNPESGVGEPIEVVDSHHPVGAHSVQPQPVALAGRHGAQLDHHVGAVPVGPRGTQQMVASGQDWGLGGVVAPPEAGGWVGQNRPPGPAGHLSQSADSGGVKVQGSGHHQPPFGLQEAGEWARVGGRRLGGQWEQTDRWRVVGRGFQRLTERDVDVDRARDRPSGPHDSLMGQRGRLTGRLGPGNCRRGGPPSVTAV